MDIEPNDIYPLLIEYLLGGCTEQERSRLLVWMEESEENRQFYFKLKALWHAKSISKNSQAGVLEQALENFKNRAVIKKKVFYKSTWLKYAAVFILILGISFFFYKNFLSSPKMIVCSVANNSDIKFVVLPDSTRVWLNKQSQLTWPDKFGKTRVVTLKGEGYFEVKKDEKRTFEVIADNISVKVLGTSFNLKINPGLKTIETTLIEGKVEMVMQTGLILGQLNPGQQALYTPQKQELTLKNVDTHFYTAWHLGTTILNNADVKDIAAAIESLYKVKVVVNTTKLNNKRFKFTIRKGQSVETVLDMMKYIAPVNFEKENNTIKINDK